MRSSLLLAFLVVANGLLFTEAMSEDEYEKLFINQNKSQIAWFDWYQAELPYNFHNESDLMAFELKSDGNSSWSKLKIDIHQFNGTLGDYDLKPMVQTCLIDNAKADSKDFEVRSFEQCVECNVTGWESEDNFGFKCEGMNKFEYTKDTTILIKMTRARDFAYHLSKIILIKFPDHGTTSNLNSLSYTELTWSDGKSLAVDVNFVPVVAPTPKPNGSAFLLPALSVNFVIFLSLVRFLF